MGASADLANLRPPLARLSGFLDRDPKNLQLLADAADAAYAEGEVEAAAGLLQRYAALAASPPALRNLAGLVAMAQGRFDEAGQTYAGLLAEAPGDPALGCNLAWCKSMAGDHEGALALLDDELTGAMARAAALKVRTLHHLGRLDEAVVAGQRGAERHPADPALMGALAVAAMDAGEAELARRCAALAGDSPEGLGTLGMLALNDGELDGSLTLFERALLANPGNARAHLGKGLGLLARGEAGAAAAHIDRCAEIFGDHVGSWVASGWAHFVGGEQAAARASFERALAIDDNFAEGHGGLAVVEIAEGRVDSARRRVEVALRLDRNCFSGALASSLIAAGDGDQQTAERIRSVAFSTALGDGRTLAQAMAAMAGARR